MSPQTPEQTNTLDDLLTTRASLVTQVANLTNDVADIKQQLDKAATIKSTTGRWADGEWFNRAQGAQRAKNNEIRRLQAQLAALSVEIRKAKATLQPGLDAAEKSRRQIRYDAQMALCRAAAKLYDRLDNVFDADMEEALEEMDRVMPGWEDPSEGPK